MIKRFSPVLLLTLFILLFHINTLQAASDSILITNASVTCGRDAVLGYLGATYTVEASYEANGERLIEESFTVSDGGGRDVILHYVEAGAGSISRSGGVFGGDWNGTTWGPPDYPYTGQIMMEMYVATDGNMVFDGPLVARSVITFTCVMEGPGVLTSAPGDPAPPFNPGDGRINPDAGAPVVVYCQEYGIDVYVVNPDSSGSLAFSATNEEIDALGESPTENTLIGSFEDVRLYRLATGEFQINAGPDAEGKEFVMIWDGC